jgi:hypothetical protein
MPSIHCVIGECGRYHELDGGEIRVPLGWEVLGTESLSRRLVAVCPAHAMQYRSELERRTRDLWKELQLMLQGKKLPF